MFIKKIYEVEMTNEIKICMGSACFARGNDKNAEIIEKYISKNNLDAKVELYGARCANICEKGPNFYINDECTNDLKKVMEYLEGLKNE